MRMIWKTCGKTDTELIQHKEWIQILDVLVTYIPSDLSTVSFTLELGLKLHLDLLKS